NETENNNFFSRANSFIPGQAVTGTFANPGTADIFKFTAIQGESYIFFCDSVPQAHYSMRVICADTTTRLTFSGDVDLSSAGGSKSIAVWTAPATDNYYLRMFYADGSGGFWRVLTGTDVPQGE